MFTQRRLDSEFSSGGTLWRRVGPQPLGELVNSVMSPLIASMEDWGKLLGDSVAVTAMLDRLPHHGHVLKCGPRSWRAKTDLLPQQAAE